MVSLPLAGNEAFLGRVGGHSGVGVEPGAGRTGTLIAGSQPLYKAVKPCMEAPTSVPAEARRPIVGKGDERPLSPQSLLELPGCSGMQE